MKQIMIIGIGAGNPEHITVQAIGALNRADVLFVTDKGGRADELEAIRGEVCDRFITGSRPRVVSIPDPERDPSGDYRTSVEDWHSRRSEIYQRLIESELGAEERGAFLVWGDPAFYDSTLRIINGILLRGEVSFDVEVIPGISSVQALAAAHAVPLHGIGESVLVTTGRRLRDGVPDGVDNVVVMLDGSNSFTTLDAEAFDIWWGGYLSTDDEVLRSGPLDEVAADIEQVRGEAKLRKGWMFDTYLLRRRRYRSG